VLVVGRGELTAGVGGVIQPLLPPVRVVAGGAVITGR
jgi:hypothetical protein